MWVAVISMCETNCAKLLPRWVRGNSLEILDPSVDAELRVHFDEPRHLVGHDFPGDDFSPVFFSGLSNHRGKRFATWTNQHTAPILGRPPAMISAGIHPIIVRFGTLLVPCLNRHPSNTSEIGFASQNTPYIPSPKGRGLYGAFSVKLKGQNQPKEIRR